MKLAIAVLVVLCGAAAVAACPDGTTCSSSETCCQTASGGYACCPAPDATCCSDHIHCCPSEYPVCDVAKGECLKSSGLRSAGVPFMQKRFPVPEPVSEPEPMTSCGGGVSCSSTETCCATASGGFACCPAPDATCCSDHIHCCPSEYPVCDVAKGECLKSSEDFFGIPYMTKRQPLKHADIIEAVNADTESTWKAGVNENFRGWSDEDLSEIMGTVLGRDPRLESSTHVEGQAPASFESSAKWPGCIGPVMNQARCGSCWAFGAAESISDRMCIEGKVSSFLQLAPLDLVTCDNGFFNNGCQGGMPSAAWQWVQSTGIVTESCSPYLVSEGGPIPTCPPSQQPCLNFVSTPACHETCKNSSLNYESDKHHISNVYSVSGEQQMMAELAKNGPFEVAMTVYADFVHYKSGVYQHKTGNALGGHAIKVVGYGTLNGTPYWNVQNSWTTSWGDDGFFKILRGQDECGIESSGVAGTF